MAYIKTEKKDQIFILPSKEKKNTFVMNVFVAPGEKIFECEISPDQAAEIARDLVSYLLRLVPKENDFSLTERVNQGGLMRCCLATLTAYLQKLTVPPKDGDVISCTCQKNNIARENGTWRWNPDGK